MPRARELLTAIATLAVAIGAGFAVESGEAVVNKYGAAGRPSFGATAGAAHMGPEPAPVVLISTNRATAVPGFVPDATIRRVTAPAAPDLPDVHRDVPPDNGGQVPSCEMTAKAQAQPGAMVAVSLSAPCAINERLTVHHHGLAFTMTTDAEGRLIMLAPALREQAVFILAFADGDGAVAYAHVPDLADVERVALQWRGAAGFELHAREFGADYGTAGHIWHGAVPHGDTQRHGVLTRLGDPSVAGALLAEIYTFPAKAAGREGTIDLSIEAEVTSANCNQQVTAHSIEMRPAGGLKKRDLTLTVPDCDAIGSFLVLNNLVSDMKVASN